MIYVFATLTIRPGTLDHLREPARICRETTLKEDGCIAYDLHADIANPDRLVFVEKWETREALSAHAKSAHVAAWREASAPHLIERKIEIVHAEKVENH
jgi:quinol monooxygenase YgiN